MTREELARLLDTAAEVLEANQAMATPAFLGLVELAAGKLKGSPHLLGAAARALGSDVNALLTSLTSVEEAVDIERRLTAEGVTEKFVGLLRAVRRRPLLLSALAALV